MEEVAQEMPNKDNAASQDDFSPKTGMADSNPNVVNCESFERPDGTFDKYYTNVDESKDIVKRFYDDNGNLMESRIHITPDGEHQNTAFHKA